MASVVWNSYLAYYCAHIIYAKDTVLSFIVSGLNIFNSSAIAASDRNDCFLRFSFFTIGHCSANFTSR